MAISSGRKETNASKRVIQLNVHSRSPGLHRALKTNSFGVSSRHQYWSWFAQWLFFVSLPALPIKVCSLLERNRLHGEGEKKPFDLFLMFNWNLKTSLKIKWKARLWNIFSAYTSKFRDNPVNRQVQGDISVLSELWKDKRRLVVNVGLHMFNNFLIIKPTKGANFSNLFWKWNSKCFGQFLCPSSGFIHCTLGNGIYHTGL
jgi:hypothetical protein